MATRWRSSLGYNYVKENYACPLPFKARSINKTD